MKTSDSLSSPKEYRFILDPPFERQRREFGKALYNVWLDGSWTVYLDELFYLIQQNKLEKPINMLLTQGRSQDITIVAGMQRPVQVSRFALSQATHVIAFYMEDRDAKILGEATSRELERTVQQLKRHQWAWFYRPDRSISVGYIQDIVKVNQ